jgi:asparagine synthase (glutamine-hydrolysing)
MCGIAGIWSATQPPDAVRRLALAMAGTLAHRGPDGEGVWLDDAAGLALSHRRLAVLELSPLGHQPMASPCGRFVVSYNGEIYNHLELRRSLDAEGLGHWRGHSDTETLVACIAAWGLETTLHRSVGMFALAVWDREERRLQLARDRFGEKPLYHGWCGGDFVFASELKAIRRHPRFDRAIDREALRTLLARGYVGGPASIYRGVGKLEPGCILTIDDAAIRARQGDAGASVSLRPYWRHADAVLAGLADPIADEREALERLEAAMGQAIREQSVADVPVGTFLSGGIDSSAVVALYRQYGAGQVRTFTIGFEDPAYDEAPYARAFAAHLGTDHVERTVSATDAQDAIRLMPAIYDEPFGDSSQIPTYLVSRLAREGVTVALTGDGADELFGGYNRYFGVLKAWSTLQRLPAPARKAVAGTLGAVPPGTWNALAQAAGGKRPPIFGEKIRRAFKSAGSAASLEHFLAGFLDSWADEGSPVLGGASGPSRFLDPGLGASVPPASAMMHADVTDYLRDDLLCKVDRAAMAVSLETRAPFLDHRVAELAARIPLAQKMRSGEGKLILKRLLFQHAPRALFDRPKAGFAVPIGAWLRGPLRGWAEAMLAPERLTRQGYLDPGMIHRRWEAHLAGRTDAAEALWPVLMFQAWLDAQNSVA